MSIAILDFSFALVHPKTGGVTELMTGVGLCGCSNWIESYTPPSETIEAIIEQSQKKSVIMSWGVYQQQLFFDSLLVSLWHLLIKTV